MAVQKMRHMKRVYPHSITVWPPAALNAPNHAPVNPAAAVVSNRKSLGRLLSKPVLVEVKPDHSVRRAKACAEAKRVVEQAVAEWIAAELRAAQTWMQ